MLPYLLVLGFTTIWIALEKKTVNRKSFWTPLFTLSLFAGMREYTVGTDSWNYTYNFRYNLNTYNFSFSENVEYGYQIFEYTLLQFTHNYFWLFFISALFIVSSFLTIIRKYSVNYLFSYFLYFTLGIYTFFFNGLRQGIAIAIVAIAIPFILKKKIIQFLLFVGFASLFHISAIILIPFYFLINLNIKTIYKLIIPFFISLVGSQVAIKYFAADNPRYKNYVEDVAEANGLVTLSFYITVMIMLYFVSYFYKIRNSNFTTLLTLYSSGIMLVIPLALLGADPSGPQRILNYFIWLLVLLIPISLKRVNNIFIYAVSVGLFLAFFIITTLKFSNLAPYTINPIFKVF